MKSYTGKAPLHQKWCDRDFLADTIHMHWQARLFYRALLQAGHNVSTRPDLPDDDDQLRKILGGVPKDIWDEHRESVRAMLTPDEVNGVKVLWQKRLREDWNGIEDYRKQQSGLAKRKWDKRREALSHFDADPMPTQCQGSAEGDANAVPSDCEGNAKGMPRQKVGSAKAEGSSAKLSQEEEEGEGMAHPSHLSSSGSTEQKLAADMRHLSAVCYELLHKTPKLADVQRLLRNYPSAEIEEALRELVGGLEERELPYVELTFFAQGGAEGVITARREKAAAAASKSRSNVAVE